MGTGAGLLRNESGYLWSTKRSGKVLCCGSCPRGRIKIPTRILAPHLACEVAVVMSAVSGVQKIPVGRRRGGWAG